jgi:uncharacterized protein YidB (DUF937 family)
VGDYVGLRELASLAADVTATEAALEILEEACNAAGSLGDLLKGVLGGGAAGTVLIGGLNDLLKQLQQNGHGDVANSWVGTGQNKAIAPKDLASALGADRINALMAYSGMSREDMLSGLSKHLPNVVDKLTPEGRLPTEEEAARLVRRAQLLQVAEGR